jgi:transcription-repair coupling factor (superfamily II helicase)
VEFRGERLSVTPLELDAPAVRCLRERIPEAMYESRVKTLSVRVPGDPDERLAAVLGLAEKLGESAAEPIAA